MADERNEDVPGNEPPKSAGPPRPARGGRRGRATRPSRPDRPCLNCGDPTPGEYCPSCGQRKVQVQVSVRTLAMDVLEDQFILDKRLPRTLRSLLFRPGHLTVEYVNGRMVRYIHPFRLYLVSSLIFFLLLSFFGLQFVRETMEREGAVAVSATGTASLVALEQIREQLADTTLTEEERTQLREAEAALLGGRGEAPPDSVQMERQQEPSQQAQTEEEDATTIGEMTGWDETPPTVSFGVAAVDSAAAGQLRRLALMTPREAAETLAGTFFNYAPTMMFILLPVFAVVLKLLYIRRRRFYAEHFIFLLHVHSVVFILATVLLLFRNTFPGWIEALLGAWILVYIYVAMKRVYGQGWLKTLAKYWTLGWMYFWILLTSLILAFLATLLLF